MKLAEVREKLGDEFIPAVERELRRLAGEFPDLRYTAVDCKYNRECHYDEPGTGDETPGCIFGQALLTLGWDDATERAADTAVDALPGIGAVPARRWLRVQHAQDTGETWSEAVSELDIATEDDEEWQ